MQSVSSWLFRNDDVLHHEHGWDVGLQCPECKRQDLPTFNGWTPNNTIRLGNQATIYANLACPKCGSDLQNAAAAKLVELFQPISIPRSNRNALLLMVMLPIVLVGVIWGGVLAGWWGPWTFALLTLLPILAPATNRWIASHRLDCECGHPSYKFMGMLGRSYCYRCSSCGKLLRLRD